MGAHSRFEYDDNNYISKYSHSVELKSKSVQMEEMKKKIPKKNLNV